MENNSTTKEYEQMMKEYSELCKQEAIKEAKLKAEWKNKLQEFIPNLDVLFNWLNEHNSWEPKEIVEIYNVEEKRSGYSNHQHIRIKDDKDRLLYMKQDEDEEEVGVNHFCIWQTSGYLGDDYSGYLLFPLSDGRYFKVSYSC